MAPETFVAHCKVLHKYIRSEKEIVDRIIHTIKTPENLLDFDSINIFFKVLIFKNACIEEKLTFIGKFFKFKSSYFTIEDFLEFLKFLTEP